ncbi:hypothetical protein WJX82_007785 [Trebouxia sp. C0006]
MRQGLSLMSFRTPVALAHTHANHSSKYLTRIHMDRSANLQIVSCSAAPGVGTEAPASAKDFDFRTFATANPAPTSDASAPDTSWICPVWNALKPASAAAICVVARAVGGKGVLLALSCAGHVGLCKVQYAPHQASGRFAGLGSKGITALGSSHVDEGLCPSFAATYSSACDAFKTCVKVPQLSALMSPGPATDNNTGAKHAWQALVLLFLGVAAATLNGGVGAKGVCLAAMTLLEFGKPVWVWVGLCVALAMWQKEHWNSKFGSAAVAAVICSMYVLTMQLVTSAAYWNECLWREIRISNSVFQGVVRVMESSAEALSRETAKGGIEFVGLLLTWGCRLLLLCSLAMFFRAVLSPDTVEKPMKATQDTFTLVRPAASASKVTETPILASPAAMSHAKAPSSEPSQAKASPVSSAAEAPADTVKTAASPAAAAEAGGIAAAPVSPKPVEPDVLVASALPDSLSIHMKAVNDFLAHEDNLHLEDTKEHNGNAAAGEDESAMTARAEEDEGHIRPAFASAPTMTLELMLKGRSGAGKQANAAGDWSTPAAIETSCATQSTSQPQASSESRVAVQDSAEQKQASTWQETAPNLSDSTHTHDDPNGNNVQVIVDPRLFM